VSSDDTLFIVEVRPDVYDVHHCFGTTTRGRVIAHGLALRTCIKIAQEEGAEYGLWFEFLDATKDKVED
jgi:hypothetical protein